MSDSPMQDNFTHPKGTGDGASDFQSPQQTPNTRRSFLGSIGATGMGALFACFSRTALAASTAKDGGLQIDSIQETKTLRNDTIPVPGGKEVFLDQQAIGANGVTQLVRMHSIRTDTEVAYTMHADIVVQSFAPGNPPTGTPDASRTMNLSISGIKGEVEGNIRKDLMTITFLHEDGTSTRTSQEVPVRLDVSQYDDLTPDQSMRLMFEAHKSGRLPL